MVNSATVATASVMTVSTPSKPLEPDQAHQLYIGGVNRLQYGDLEGAQRLLSQARDLDPTAAATHYELGNCFRRQRRPAEAESAFKTALDLDPSQVAAWFGLSFLYAENGRLEEAMQNLTKTVNNFPGNMDIQHQAGGLMGQMGLYKEATALYEEILKQQPQARNHLRLGQYYQKMGRFEDAARHLTAAIDMNPNAGAAYLLLANTRRFGETQADRALMQRFAEALDDPALSRDTRTCLYFSLGKIHDDRDSYDAAFGYFERGNALRREGQAFQPQAWLDMARQVEGLGSRDIAAAGARKHSGPAPLFVVGMLRNGTTLVERILASHPQVTGLGETAWLAETVARADSAASLAYPGYLAQLDAGQIASLRDEYLRHWPKTAAKSVTFMADKNPLNFLYIGLIARLFPEAKIVHCRRDARDASLSVYFQNFASPNNTYAYDLTDIAHFHNGYTRMMKHWARILPPGMLHSIDYEELVADQEGQTRALLAGLGLPWNDACLAFDTHADNIATASVWQARQPLYTQSVGRWRRYERHLGPLLNTLAPL